MIPHFARDDGRGWSMAAGRQGVKSVESRIEFIESRIVPVQYIASIIDELNFKPME